MNKTFSRSKVQRLTLLALMTALVIVLQLLVVIKLGAFNISVVMMPIVVGAALLGPSAGAWLGFVFGVTVLLSGDAALFMSYSVIGTVITVIVKGIRPPVRAPDGFTDCLKARTNGLQPSPHRLSHLL